MSKSCSVRLERLCCLGCGVTPSYSGQGYRTPTHSSLSLPPSLPPSFYLETESYYVLWAKLRFHHAGQSCPWILLSASAFSADIKSMHRHDQSQNLAWSLCCHCCLLCFVPLISLSWVEARALCKLCTSQPFKSFLKHVFYQLQTANMKRSSGFVSFCLFCFCVWFWEAWFSFGIRFFLDREKEHKVGQIGR